MDYEKRYKALLEQAKEELKTCGSLDCDAAKQIFRFFPELQESEDERVRKAAIAFVKASDHFGYHLGISKENVLSWLEKQGESIDKEKVEIGARKDLALSIINYLDNNRVKGCMNLSSMECEDIEDACINSKWTKLYNYMKKKLETPDVSDYNPYKATVKSIITMTERYANGNDLRDFYDNVKVKCKEAVDYDKTWLEKTSKQESTDKVEFWFTVGDWVVQRDGACFASGDTFAQITNIDDEGRYWLDCGTWITGREIRHWTVADAKDGDILISACNHPFIYNGNSDASLVGGYGGIATACGFKPSAEKCHWTENINIHPATKEEQEYLFQKMAEVGYMWDDYTKSIFCVRSLND